MRLKSSLLERGTQPFDFLIRGDAGNLGKAQFVKFLDDAMQTNQWPEAIQRNYGIADLSALQNTWLAWVRDGFPAAAPVVAVAADPRRQRPEPNLIYRDNVRLTSGGSGAPTAQSVASPVKQATAILPAQQGESQVMPASGWHTPTAAPSATEATRPQAMEPARQVILQP